MNKDVYIFTKGNLSPLELRQALADARLHSQRIVGACINGVPIYRTVMPAKDNEAVIYGVNCRP